MSTSKIGRAIHPRDVVSPGHSKSRTANVPDNTKKELERLSEICVELEVKYDKLRNRFNNLEHGYQQKKVELALVKEELQNKEHQMVAIRNHVSDLEFKLNKIAGECEQLRQVYAEKNQSKPEEKVGWKKLF